MPIRQFKSRPDARGRVRFRPDPGGPSFYRQPRAKAEKPCAICALPDIERLRLDLRIVSGYLGGAQHREHLKHMAKDIVEASKFRDGTYGDVLLGELEWAMKEARDIATDARGAEKPKTALSALKTLSELVGAQAKLLGLGVPRAGGKVGININVGRDLGPGELQKIAEAFVRTGGVSALPAPQAMVEVESVEAVAAEPEPTDN